jgi:hypothetical protein
MNADTKARYLGLLGLGVIAVWITLSMGSAFYMSVVSLRWPKVPARVISAQVNTGKSTVGTWWAPSVEYDYQVSGRPYHSAAIRYLMPTFYEKENAQAVTAPYEAGGAATASYDPRDPSRSVLEPGVPAGMWKRAFIPLFFWALIVYIHYEINHPNRRIMLRSNPEPVPEEEDQRRAA